MGKAIPNTEIPVLNEQGGLVRLGKSANLFIEDPPFLWDIGGDQNSQLKSYVRIPLLPPELGGRELVCYSGDLVETMKRDSYILLAVEIQ
ncbi:MAG: hypothetical protein R3B95_10195 [Nitrospirales bacterium]|nr:hypothetical protein [Nitrospirales bacterium]